MRWFITNKSLGIIDKIKNFKTNITNDFFIEGYIIPRLKFFNQYKHLNQEELVKKLYLEYQGDFVHYIKGVFTIIIFNKSGFQIFSDRHSIKKYFVYQIKDEFYISNSLSLIAEHYNMEIDKESAVLFFLTSHFFNGSILFKNLQSNLPAQKIKYENNSLNISTYWKPEEIFKTKPVKNDIEFYVDTWSKLIVSYIDYLQPKDVSITLTGGNDSRLILAALLSQKKIFHAFTFGNPLSYDGLITSKLKDTVNINHDFYFIKNPTKEWFQHHARELVNYGQGLINIHRAHRNDAIVQEKRKIKDTEMLFTGLVGGEYFKETLFNDITLPKFFKKLIDSKSKMKGISILLNELEDHNIQTSRINVESIYNKINFFLNKINGLNQKQQKFILTYLFYGSAHHTQDSNVFGEHIKYVVNPFMDIDFIEMIASHPKWYINKKSNFLNRFFHSLFFIEITHRLAPELSHIPYAKKGMYSANDILNHKLVYLLKRFFYLINRDRDKYPANFPMGKWLYHFCEEELSQLSPEILNFFNLNTLDDRLNQIKEKTTEKSWHVITNPINLNLIYEHYKKN